MGVSRKRRTRQRGAVDQLPSGAYRVRVYAGIDPVTRRTHTLVETIPAGPQAAKLAEEARVKLLNQVYEQRNPKTKATVEQMMERYLDEADLDVQTLKGYRGRFAD
jgi:integrase